jgi:gamma-glutamylcyclotransferase (GGCT)/AIG2-like uncharacterized protein YtfP
MTAYFAYGANLDRAHMARTAPGARALGIGRLENHRLAIGGSGYGTLLPAPGREVWGLLWSLTPTDEAALDQFEGVARGFYCKGDRDVIDGSGTRHRAMVYLATDRGAGAADPDYLRQVLAAATALGFPESYLREISRLPTGTRTGDRWTPPAERVNGPKAPAR